MDKTKCVIDTVFNCKAVSYFFYAGKSSRTRRVFFCTWITTVFIFVLFMSRKTKQKTGETSDNFLMLWHMFHGHPVVLNLNINR